MIIRIHHEDLLPIFRRYCDENFCSENILFYLEIEKYQLISRKFQQAMIQGDVENVKEYGIQKSYWDALCECGRDIYRMFIQVPHAPLEININHQHRIDIIKVLFGDDTSMISSQGLEYPPVYQQSHSSLNSQDLNSILTGFDSAQIAVGSLMKRDAFPRFMKTSVYIKTVRGFRSNNSVETV